MAYDHWCTPQWLAEIIGPVDTDPCGNEWSMVKSEYSYRGKDHHDGLTMPWPGSVFVNPPYSDPTPWSRRWAEHNGPKLWLSEGSVGTKWFGEIIESAEHVWFFRKRLAFYHPEKGANISGARSGHILATRDRYPDLFRYAIRMVGR